MQGECLRLQDSGDDLPKGVRVDVFLPGFHFLPDLRWLTQTRQVGFMVFSGIQQAMVGNSFQANRFKCLLGLIAFCSLFTASVSYAASDDELILGCSEDPVLADSSYDFSTGVEKWIAAKTSEELPHLQGTINKIHTSRLPIFDESDPKENRFLYRLANRFNITTKEKTILQALLFKEGDIYDADLLEENSPYVTQASISVRSRDPTGQ